MLTDDRARLRRDMAARRDALDAELRRSASAEIARHLMASGIWRDARSVFAYFAVGSEVQTMALMEAALREGKALYLPRCQSGGRMQAVRVCSLDALIPGRFGIPEPPEGEALEGAPGLCVTPGLAFDAGGGRIGYGGGYYDRFLSADRCTAAALAYECQVIRRVPTEAHDVPMDYIITPEGILTCDERA